MQRHSAQLLLLQLLAAACSHAQTTDTSLAAAPAPVQLGASSCAVTASIGSSWQLSSTGTAQFATSLELQVSNTGGSAITVPYTVSVANPAYVAALSAINWQYSTPSSGGVIGGVASQYFLSLQPLSLNSVTLGLVVSASTNASSLAPTSVAIAGQQCTLSIAAPAPPPPPSSGAIESGSGGLSTSQGQITFNNQPITLRGINYFGFDDGNTMVDGLWEGSSDLTLDFQTVVHRIQLLGFNAVRLPFSFQYVFNKAPTSQSRSCAQTTPDVALQSVTHPGITAPSSGPQLAFTAPRTPGVCSDYIPSDTTLNRLAYVVSFFARNGIFVVLDNQLNLDMTVLTAGTQQWLSYWTQLIQACSADPVASQYIIVDILNEPDVASLGWTSANGLPGYGDLALAAMDAIYPINPAVLFFIEGCGQSGYVQNWGDGIVTDPQLIQQYGLTSPRPFFETVVTRPYVSQVVAAPHVYCPSISMAQDRYTGGALWQRLSDSFGYLNKEGYCADNGQCTQFAVAIGETGTAFTDPRDASCMADFAAWLNAAGGANDGLHNSINNVFWWAWNANSGDTKGLVDSDWLSVLWNKVDWLTGVGLVPWYTPAGQSAQLYTSPVVSTTGAGIEDFSAVAGVNSAAVQAFSPDKYSQSGAGDGFTPLVGSGVPTSGARTESAATSGLTTANGTILGVNGVAVDLKGVIWHGFDNGNTMLSGLTEGNSSLSEDFATQVQRILALGFNTVKVPFSFNDLYNLVPTNFSEACTTATAAELTASVTNPNMTVPPGRTIPDLSQIVAGDPGTCNAYLPSDTTINRFLFVVQFLAGNGLYVVLDNNLSFDKTVLNPAQWLMSWATLVSAVSADEASRARLILDLLDTPDTVGLAWEAQSGLPGAGDLYLAAMEALYPINPAMLFLIEGTAQPQFAVNAGDGYVTSTPLLEATGASNPSAFFRSLLTKPYAVQVVIAPHVLPPSITGNNATGQALFTRLSTSFGYLNYGGFCANTAASFSCKNFPVMIGSFGSALTSPADVAFMNDLALYLASYGVGNDGVHRPIGSFIWNSWTADVLVTGGILDTDAVSIVWPKIDYLSSSYLQLAPWYTPPTADHGRTGYITTSAAAAPANTCSANVSVSNAGRSGDSYLASLQVTLKDAAPAPIFTPWTLSVENSNYTGVVSSFGLNLSSSAAGSVSGQATQYYDILWPSGTNNVTVNLVVQSSYQDLTPTGILINGIACGAALVPAPSQSTGPATGVTAAALGPNAPPAAGALAVESMSGRPAAAPANAAPAPVQF